jgi:hypothetical protein
MKKSIPGIFVFLLIILLSSCASVNFYSDPNLTNETGLKIYNAKPYLLVQTGSDKTDKTTVIWLPDYSNPQYITVKPGFGSNELKLAFTNGSLSSYGSTTEGSIPDIIDAIASFVSKSAYAANNLNAPPPSEQEGIQEVYFELYEIVFGKEGVSLKKINVSE